MKKNLKFMGVACASLLLLGGCGEVPTLSDGTDALVTFEEIDGISVDTLYESLKVNYGIDTLISMIDKQIFEIEFADELDAANESAEYYISYYTSMYGSEEDFLAALSGSFSTIEGYQDYLYVSYLQNLAIESYSELQITDDQIEKYYEEEYYADVELAHILITSDASSSADEDEIAEAEAAAEETAEEIIDLLNEAKDNGEDIEEYFAELALEYSDDSATSSNGGNIGVINYEDFDYNYDEFVDMSISLSDGEFSTTVVETELGFHIILKIETSEKADLEDVSDDIKLTLSNNNLASDYTLIIDALEYFRTLYGFEITDPDLVDAYNTYMEEYSAYLTETYAS